jgi:hypothetical protein
MKEPHRTMRYRKDERLESLLERMNQLLEPLEEELAGSCDSPTHPVVFVVGLPRAGTTLVSQLLAHWGGFGFVSNLMARFWSAPTVGALLQKQILQTVPTSASSYSSEYGVTRGAAEPHEFGYFWDRWFDQEQGVHKLDERELSSVDGKGLRREIASMEAALGRPLVFKNNTWCTFQMAFLANLLPTALFVICERSPLYVAQSILIARKKRLGSQEHWWSVRPREYPTLRTRPWWIQIGGQVFHSIREMEEGAASLEAERVVRAPYQEVCRYPHTVGRRIAAAVRARGGEVPSDGLAPESFESTDERTVSTEQFEKLREGLETFFGPEPGSPQYNK